MNAGPNIAIAGGMSWSVQYNLDGAQHLDTYIGTTMPLPFPDALQGFRLSTSAQEASNGGHSGAASWTPSPNPALTPIMATYLNCSATRI
jgi:hypothetical protein